MATLRWFDRLLLPWRQPGVSSTDIINAGDTAPPLPQAPLTPGVRHIGKTDEEFGVSGTENFGGVVSHNDDNPDWDNFTRSVAICEKMRRTDSQIRAISQVMKLPLLGATWVAQAPENGDALDEKIAEFVQKALFDDDAMDDAWDYTLRHILTQLDFGFSILEIVWTLAEDGTFRVKRLAPRLARTIKYWYVDRGGKLIAVVQYAPVTETKTEDIMRVQSSPLSPPPVMASYAHYQYLTMPAEYLVVFTHEREGDQYEGTSMYRNVYRNWFFKDQAYRLEGIRLDRFGVGIPVAEIQENQTVSKEELNALTEVLKKVRANQRAYLIAPPWVRYRLLPEGSTSSSGNSGAVQWIEHHDSQIVANILANFLTMGKDAHGTLGFGSRLTDLFTSNLRGIAMGIAGELKRQVVRKLCDFNFDMRGRQYPSIVVKDLDVSHVESLVETLVKLVPSAIITPDDDTEAQLRKMLKLPPQPEATKRVKAGMDPNAAGPMAGTPPDQTGVTHEQLPGQDPGAPPQGLAHEGNPPPVEGGLPAPE